MLWLFFARRTNTKLLSVALGFSAGVMIYVSFVKIFPKAKDCLVVELGQVAGYWHGGYGPESSFLFINCQRLDKFNKPRVFAGKDRLSGITEQV